MDDFQGGASHSAKTIMEQLSNQLLVESYNKAQELELNHDFIKMIEEELVRRGLYQFLKESS
ncbi:sporulation histidine kinase inhibitor Sda [Filobacillus milosensis]